MHLPIASLYIRNLCFSSFTIHTAAYHHKDNQRLYRRVVCSGVVINILCISTCYVFIHCTYLYIRITYIHINSLHSLCSLTILYYDTSLRSLQRFHLLLKYITHLHCRKYILRELSIVSPLSNRSVSILLRNTIRIGIVIVCLNCTDKLTQLCP